MDQELIDYFDARFQETAEQIAASRDETTRHIARLREETIWRFEQADKKVEETARQNLILVEELRHNLHLIAEGLLGMNARLERDQGESKDAFVQILGLIEPCCGDLDNQIRLLDGRVRLLESRADRQQGDVMNAIRKMLGKPPLPPPVMSE